MWRLEEQRARYGGYLYVRDEEGKYICFFKGCGQRLKSNISKHIEDHELSSDEFDEEYSKTALAKHRSKPEATMNNVMRLKSALVRPKEQDISLKQAARLLEDLCAICDSIPLSLANDQVQSIYPNRDFANFSLANLIFDPLKHRGYPTQNPNQAMDLGAVVRKIMHEPTPEYKDVEEFAMDVRHALNYVRIAATTATPVAPLSSSDLAWHVRRLSMEFGFRLEYERLKKRFDLAESRISAKYNHIELPYSPLIEIMQALLQTPLAAHFLEPFYDHSSPYIAADYLKTLQHPTDLLQIYEELKQGRFCANPAKLVARQVRLLFLHALLWNEHSSEAYINTDKLSVLFEQLLEKAYQKAIRALQNDFRYTVRDDDAKLLVWDPTRREYYLEYYSSAADWSQASKLMQEYNAKEAQRKIASESLEKFPALNSLRMARFMTPPIKPQVPSFPPQVTPATSNFTPTIAFHTPAVGAVPTSQLHSANAGIPRAVSTGPMTAAPTVANLNRASSTFPATSTSQLPAPQASHMTHTPTQSLQRPAMPGSTPSMTTTAQKPLQRPPSAVTPTPTYKPPTAQLPHMMVQQAQQQQAQHGVLPPQNQNYMASTNVLANAPSATLSGNLNATFHQQFGHTSQPTRQPTYAAPVQPQQMMHNPSQYASVHQPSTSVQQMPLSYGQPPRQLGTTPMMAPQQYQQGQHQFFKPEHPR